MLENIPFMYRRMTMRIFGEKEEINPKEAVKRLQDMRLRSGEARVVLKELARMGKVEHFPSKPRQNAFLRLRK